MFSRPSRLEGHFMAKKPRQIEPYSLVEVSGRTIGSRYLLKPSKQANDLIAGVLARAARLYPVEVIVFVAMSSHFHALIVAESTERLAEFMRHLNSNLALELGRFHEWRCRFWGDRYSSIQISDEEEAQVRRMKYILAGGVKEQLVCDTKSHELKLSRFKKNRGPPVPPGEPTGLNKERPGQCTKAPKGAGSES